MLFVCRNVERTILLEDKNFPQIRGISYFPPRHFIGSTPEMPAYWLSVQNLPICLLHLHLHFSRSKYIYFIKFCSPKITFLCYHRVNKKNYVVSSAWFMVVQIFSTFALSEWILVLALTAFWILSGRYRKSPNLVFGMVACTVLGGKCVKSLSRGFYTPDKILH